MSQAIKVAEVPPPKTRPLPLTGATRSRLYRERRKKHLKCVMVELRNTEIEPLIKRGSLAQEDCGDEVAIRQALYKFFEEKLR